MSKFFLFSGMFLLIILIPLGISPSLSFSSLISKINDLPKKEQSLKIQKLVKGKNSCTEISFEKNDEEGSWVPLYEIEVDENSNEFKEFKSEYQEVMKKVKENYPELSTRLLHYQDLQYAIFNLKNAQELLAIFLFAPQFSFLRKWGNLETDRKFFLKWFYNPLLSYYSDSDPDSSPSSYDSSEFKIGDPALSHRPYPSDSPQEFKFRCYSRFLFYKLVFELQKILDMDKKSFFTSDLADTTIFEQNKQKILVFLQKKIDYHLQLKLKTTKKILADNLLLFLPLYKKFFPDYYLMFFSPLSTTQIYEVTGNVFFVDEINSFCGSKKGLFGSDNFNMRKFYKNALMGATLCQKEWNNRVYSPQSFGFNRVSFLLFLRNIFAEKNNWLKRPNEKYIESGENPVSFTSSKTVEDKQGQDYYDDPFFHKGQQGKQIYIATKKVNDFFFKTYFSPDHNYDQTFANIFFYEYEKSQNQKSFVEFERKWTQGPNYDLHPSEVEIDNALRRIYSQDLSFASLNNMILTRINQKLVNLEKLWSFFHIVVNQTSFNPRFQSIIKSLVFFRKNPQYLKFIEKKKGIRLYNLEKEDLLYFLDFVEKFFQELGVSKKTINEINFNLSNSNLPANLITYLAYSEFSNMKRENIKKINSSNKIVFYSFIGVFSFVMVLFLFLFLNAKRKRTKNNFAKKENIVI